MKSSLGKFAAVGRERQPEEGRDHARVAWNTHGLILLGPEWLKNDFDRQLAITLAETAHGKTGKLMGRGARKRKMVSRDQAANDRFRVIDATPERIAKSEGSEFVDPATIDSARHRIGRVRRFKDSWIDRMYRRDQLTYAQWYAAGWYRDRHIAGFSHPKVTASYGGVGSADGVNYGQPRDERQWDARKLYRMARDLMPPNMVRLVEGVVIDDQMPPFRNGQHRARFAERIAAALQPVAEWIGAPGADVDGGSVSM